MRVHGCECEPPQPHRSRIGAGVASCACARAGASMHACNGSRRARSTRAVGLASKIGALCAQRGHCRQQKHAQYNRPDSDITQLCHALHTMWCGAFSPEASAAGDVTDTSTLGTEIVYKKRKKKSHRAAGSERQQKKKKKRKSASSERKLLSASSERQQKKKKIQRAASANKKTTKKKKVSEQRAPTSVSEQRAPTSVSEQRAPTTKKKIILYYDLRKKKKKKDPHTECYQDQTGIVQIERNETRKQRQLSSASPIQFYSTYLSSSRQKPHPAWALGGPRTWSRQPNHRRWPPWPSRRQKAPQHHTTPTYAFSKVGQHSCLFISVENAFRVHKALTQSLFAQFAATAPISVLQTPTKTPRGPSTKDSDATGLIKRPEINTKTSLPREHERVLERQRR